MVQEDRPVAAVYDRRTELVDRVFSAAADRRDNMTLSDYLRSSSRALIFTGAGISTGSGIPDFRGPNGVWKRRRPVYLQDFIGSEAARLEHWDYKLEAWESFRTAQPNDVHHAIARLERAGKLRAVVTQNIDGLHTLAGTSGALLVELHGTNAQVECLDCGRRDDPRSHFEYFQAQRQAPRCECGGFLKPATISFGQALRKEDIRRATKAAAEADLVIALGSTLSVHPAASIPLLAAERNLPYVVINRGPTDHDFHPCVTLRLEGDVGEIFPAAVDAALA